MDIERKIKEALHTMPNGFTSQVRQKIMDDALQASVKTRRKLWSAAAATLGVLCCVVLAAGLLLHGRVLTLPRQTPTVGQKSSPTSLKGAKTVTDWGAYLQFRMVTKDVGWTVANGDTQVLRTTDGGIRWGNVSPIQISTFGGPKQIVIASDFVDTAHASIAVSANNGLSPAVNGPVIVYSTSDGGTNWIKARLTLPSKAVKTPISISFVNPQTGWVMVGIKDRNHVDIFHTSDGGKSWKQISTTGTGTRSQNGLPVMNEKIGMTFVSDKEGFISLLGSQATPGQSPLYKSVDGGVTWTPVKLDLPGTSYDFGIPVAFTPPSTGIFGLEYLDPSPAVVFFSSTNAGHDWRKTGELKYDVPQGTQYATWDVVNKDDLFVAAGGKVYASHDGGRTWHSHPISNDIHQVSFINTQVGFGSGLQGQLYTTIDGGGHWTKLTPLITG